MQLIPDGKVVSLAPLRVLGDQGLGRIGIPLQNRRDQCLMILKGGVDKGLPLFTALGDPAGEIPGGDRGDAQGLRHQRGRLQEGV